MIAAATHSCPRCEMPCRRGVEWVQPHLGICRCGLIFTDRPLTQVDRFVAGQARALTMAWSRQPPWPWSPQKPPQAATCSPTGGDA